MPLLVGILGIRTATPLVALVGITSEIVILLRYRHALNIQAVAKVALASAVGIPLGVFLLRRVDAEIITRLLGIILIGYALYALFSPTLPPLTHPLWAYGLGFASGLLGGAYNTSGPPVIIYGSCRRWSPAEFKSNLQSLFLLNSLIALVAHILIGNVTQLVWHNYLVMLPGIFLGLVSGFSLDSRIDSHVFRRIVLVLLILLGLRLLF